MSSRALTNRKKWREKNAFLHFLKGMELGDDPDQNPCASDRCFRRDRSPALCDSMDSTSEGWESRRKHRSCHPITDRNEQTSLWVNKETTRNPPQLCISHREEIPTARLYSNFPPPGFTQESSHRRVLLYLPTARLYSNFPPPAFTPSSTRIFPPSAFTPSSRRIQYRK